MGQTKIISFCRQLRLCDGGIAIMANTPQLWNICFRQDSSGVSTLSLAEFLMGSIFWFGYEVLHKEKPIAVIDASLIVI